MVKPILKCLLGSLSIQMPPGRPGFYALAPVFPGPG